MAIRTLLNALWRRRAGPILVCAQVAITLAIVVNVAYIIVSRLEVGMRPTGMDLENVFWVRSEVHSQDYNLAVAAQSDLAYLNSLPGVRAAALANGLPQYGGGITMGFMGVPHDVMSGADQRRGYARVYFGTERYVETLGLTLAAGRMPTAQTVTPPSVSRNGALARWTTEVVITQALAQRIFPNENPIGKTIYAGLTNRSATVVGVVERMQHSAVRGDQPEIFTEFVVIANAMAPGPNSYYLVRTEPGRQDEVMRVVERDFEQLQRGRYVPRMDSLANTIWTSKAWNVIGSISMAVTACFVLLVTALGIFGLASYSVATRIHEIGIRRALGARKHHIFQQFILETGIVMTTGIVGGVVLAMFVGTRLSAMFELPKQPPLYLIIGTLVLCAVGFLAAFIPARKAASIAPAMATRVA
jgi:putative ABC transport system permease protein